MTLDEARRVVELARRIGCTPHDLLLAAARMVDAPATPAAVLAALRTHRQRPTTSADMAALLLLSAPSSYALGHVEDALASFWGPAPRPAD